MPEVFSRFESCRGHPVIAAQAARENVRKSMRSPTGSCRAEPVSARSLAAQDRRRYRAVERA